MSESYAMMKEGTAKQWQVDMANKAIEYVADGIIFQQKGIGLKTAVFHSCPNMGEPFDRAKHKAAHAVWEKIESLDKKPTGEDKKNLINELRRIWDEA